MTILILIVILMILSLVIGGEKTAKSLVTLGMNAGLLAFAIGALFLGAPSLIVAVVTCISVSLITVFYQNEVNVKSKVAFLSVVIVIGIMIGLITILVYGGHLQGMPTVGQHEIRESNGYAGDVGRNMVMIQVLVMVMALLGSVIDMAIAITSGAYEVAKHNPGLNGAALMGSGLKIGRDILSSTVNTLFFIFAGESLVMFINFVSYYSMSTILNSKQFAQSAIIMLVCAVGCVIIIPIAAFLGAVGFRSNQQMRAPEEKEE